MQTLLAADHKELLRVNTPKAAYLVPLLAARMGIVATVADFPGDAVDCRSS